MDGWRSGRRGAMLGESVICGESGDVSGETVESWKEKLPELARGYNKEDIWNMDETGCFWRALPDKSFGMKGKGREEV